jgi:hypothetical protein
VLHVLLLQGHRVDHVVVAGEHPEVLGLDSLQASAAEWT